MKPQILDKKSHGARSFRVRRHNFPYFLKVWHCHPEIELVLLLESTGTRFVGDSIEKFEPGQVVLLGENLPHMWMNDDVYFDPDSNLKADAIAVHFKVDFLGMRFFEAPELQKVQDMINRAGQGILFRGVEEQIRDILFDLLTAPSLGRIIKLLSVLKILADWKDYSYLSSKGFAQSFDPSPSNHLNQVYEYIYTHFHRTITLREIAEIAHMNPSAFSRFFKRIHKKTFTRYLNEIRIGYACKLLIEGELKIAAICYDSGFNNLSNFNRQFKRIRGMSPTEYQSLYKY